MAMKRVCDWCREEPVVECRPHFDEGHEPDHYDACPQHMEAVIPIVMALAYPNATRMPEHAEVTITFTALHAAG